MQSRKVPGLFFAGEIRDVDGITAASIFTCLDQRVGGGEGDCGGGGAS